MSKAGFTEFHLLMMQRDLPTAVESLSQLDQVQIRLPLEDVPRPDSGRKHPSYHLSFPEVASLIVSASSLITSLASLATAIMALKKATREAKEREKESGIVLPAIAVSNLIKPISEFHNEAELREFLENHLQMQRNALKDSSASGPNRAKSG